MNRKTDCNYPYCDKCNNEFTIPLCILEEAKVEIEANICIIPKEGYVIIKNDEEE